MSGPGPFLPAPPYVAVLFRARAGADRTGYEAMDAALEEAVRQASGYLGHFSAVEPDGTTLTVSYWRDRASVAAWKAHAGHARAQGEGRARWYDWYAIEIAEVREARQVSRVAPPADERS
ncbi:MAG: antibiotic biosynthesis monooxygenase [Alphaproteobacteria bacterium]|nr:antibiotic biosynthesis monooxygenase [Alphaproteobacteria bacterium]